MAMKPMNGRQAVGLALVLAGAALGVLWMSGRLPHPGAPVVALFLFLAGTSLFSKVSGLAEKMRPLLGKNVRVQVWGSDLPGNPGSRFAVCPVRARGFGLHVLLRPWLDGGPTHLKVAQPRETTIGDAGLKIGEAKYVQWAGTKIKKVEGEMALVLIVNGGSPDVQEKQKIR